MKNENTDLMSAEVKLAWNYAEREVFGRSQK